METRAACAAMESDQDFFFLDLFDSQSCDFDEIAHIKHIWYRKLSFESYGLCLRKSKKSKNTRFAIFRQILASHLPVMPF